MLSLLIELANINSLLDLASKIARFSARAKRDLNRRRNTPGLSDYVAESRAIDATFQEWEKLAFAIEPELSHALSKLHTKTFAQRAGSFASLAGEYAHVPHGDHSDELDDVHLVHTAIDFTQDGKLRARFGQSDETRALRGKSVSIRAERSTPILEFLNRKEQVKGGNMALPVFKITMLGDSASGKTVFMSSMYNMLRHGIHGMAIRAIDSDQDIELGNIMKTLIMDNKWPPGTDKDQLRYEFELQLNNRAIARIDWIDYRGGAIWGQKTEDEASKLSEQLRQSQAIIWMVDLSILGSRPVHTNVARTLTNVGRLAQLCREALASNNDPRAWIFVRTKSDLVRGSDGKPDWSRACTELVQHLGEITDIAKNRSFSRAVALPVSSVGRLSGLTEGKLIGDDPSFVEWPLILSLALLFDAEVCRLRKEMRLSNIVRAQVQAGPIEGFFRDVFNLGPKEEEARILSNLNSLQRQLVGIGYLVEELLKKHPPAVKFLHR